MTTADAITLLREFAPDSIILERDFEHEQAIDDYEYISAAAAALPFAQEQTILKAFAQVFCSNAEIVAHYTEGSCHKLAMALRRLTGKNMATCHMSTQENHRAYGCHCFILLDDETALDIKGIHNLSDLLAEWANEMRFACGVIGDSGEPSHSICNDAQHYDVWFPCDGSLTDEDYDFVAKQLAFLHNIALTVEQNPAFA